MQSNSERLENLLVSQDFSTFNLLEHKRNPPVGALDNSVPITPTGTDQDEYQQWLSSQGGTGLGEVIYDDPDDARDAAEFSALSGTNQSVTE